MEDADEDVIWIRDNVTAAMANDSCWSRIAKCRYYLRIFLTHLFSQVGLCALVVGYAVVGALTFEYLEATYELSQRSSIQEHREECLRDLWIITETANVLHETNWTIQVRSRLRSFEQEVVKAVKNEGYDGKESSDSELQWSFSGALLYCITVITTIGYGNIAPKTDVGKVVTIFYALLGIPLMLLCLTNIGNLLARSFKFAYSKLCNFCVLFRNPRRQHNITNQKPQVSPVDIKVSTEKTGDLPTVEICKGDEKVSCSEASSPPSSPSPKIMLTNDNSVPEASQIIVEHVYAMRENIGSMNEQRVPVYMVLLLVTGYICGGAVLFSEWENWTFLNGAYFCFITLSTIGFGDLVPGSNLINATEGEQVKLIICCIYLILGLAIIAMSFSLVQEEVIIKCKNFARNLGLIESEDGDEDD